MKGDVSTGDDTRSPKCSPSTCARASPCSASPLRHCCRRPLYPASCAPSAADRSPVRPTSETGQYRLVVPNDGFATVDSLTVIARAIGYEPMSQRVAARPGSFTVDFGLKATTLRLEAVVVTGAVGASDAVSSRGGKDGTPPTVARRKSSAAELRDAPRPMAPALAKSRADGSRVAGRASAGSGERQDPSPGILTAAVWNDAEHWQQYSRFLDRARENAWNPWGLEVGKSRVQPVRADIRPRSPRRALDLGFLVDATGSMGDEMSFLQSEIKDIVRRVRSVEPNLDIRLSVVFYRDRGDARRRTAAATIPRT